MGKETDIKKVDEPQKMESENEGTDELPSGFPDEKDFRRFLGCGG